MDDRVTVKRRKLSDYKPDPRNANKGTERGHEVLVESIRELGAARSVVATADGTIPAGNKTLEAAREAGIEDVIEVETGGDVLVVVKRRDWESIEDEPARLYAYYDNRASELGLEWDIEQIAADLEAGLDLESLFTEDELIAIGLGQGDNGQGEVAPEPGDGSLLSLVNISVDEPRHQVATGDIWHLGQHVLVCASVLTDWSLWKQFLRDDERDVFAPYAGPSIALSERAQEKRLIIVQPDPLIAGYTLDLYADVYGEDAIRRD